MKKVGARLKEKISYYGPYTILFSIVVVVILGFFALRHKSLIYYSDQGAQDGLVQHYNAFIYYGRYLRQLLATVFIHHSFDLPTWDMSIGYGQDIISTLTYYVIGDPFSLLSVLVPTQFSELAYNGLIVLRLYVAGLAFLAFCYYKGYERSAASAGALLYVFCGFGLFGPLRHPYFALPMVFFPFLLIGIEKILAGQKKTYYIVTLALAGMANFYFFYMLCLLVLGYTVLRYIELYGIKDFKHLLLMVGQFILTSLLSVGMAAVLLIPTIVSFLGVSRVGIVRTLTLFYSLSRNLTAIPSLLVPVVDGYSNYGYTALGVIAILVLFASLRSNKDLAPLAFRFGLLMAASFLPMAGHVFNGFGYASNRWIWALGFSVSHILVVMFPRLLNQPFGKIAKLVILCGLGLLMGLSYVSYRAELLRSELLIVIDLQIFVTLGFLIWIRKPKWQGKRSKPTLAFLSFLVMVNSLVVLFENQGRYQIESGQAYEKLTKNTATELVAKLEDESVYRFDSVGVTSSDLMVNSAMLWNQNGIGYYFSTLTSPVADFIDDMQLNYDITQKYYNLDGRSLLESLFTVKYLAIPKGKEALLPYAYNQLVSESGKFTLYQSDYALPFGYTSATTMSRVNYEALSPLDKQAALLETVIVENAGQLQKASLSSLSQNQDYTITDADGLEVKNHAFDVHENKASVTLTFAATANQELYFQIEGLKFSQKGQVGLFASEDAKKTNLKLISGQHKAILNYRTQDDNFYSDNHDFLVNLGHEEDGRTSITIRFAKPGFYSFDKLKVLTQDVQKILEDSSKLSQEHLEKVIIKDDRISGELNLSQDKLLVVQVPAIDGWSVTVDGEKQKLQVADKLFLAVEVKKGQHKVVFTYQNPYLAWSAVVSLISLCLFGMLCYHEHKSAKKE
ncbi:YfhO family protein [Streptococcus caprae]|uniref:YfhO family protein n=1 Tax=Streptococcus caprae TaxID=1640501 RepID=A0ABV8CV32_9STRE